MTRHRWLKRALASLSLLAVLLLSAWCAIVLPPYDRTRLVHPAGVNWTSIDDVSPHLVNAILAAEDRDFEDHNGFDALAAMRAFFLTATGKGRFGGSTITMQLAKVCEPGNSRPTIGRHFRMAVYAIRLERTLSKREILEQYVNRVYFANGIFGVDAAAHRYFAKAPKDLSVADAALLAGMLRAPTVYNPLSAPQVTVARRDHVLDLIATAGLEPQADVDLARREKFTAP